MDRWMEFAEKYILVPLDSSVVKVAAFLVGFLPCVLIGFSVGGVGGAMAGALAGCLVGGWVAYYGPAVVAAVILIGVPLLGGLAVVLLVIFLIMSLWGVGKPA